MFSGEISPHDPRATVNTVVSASLWRVGDCVRSYGDLSNAVFNLMTLLLLTA